MRRLVVLCLVLVGWPLLFGPNPQAFGQEARVTFYSSGSFSGHFLPDSKHSAFIGYIFDGDSEIGFVPVGRYLTFRLSPGVHVFSASLSKKHPATNSQLSMDLSSGKDYFVRIQEETKAALILGLFGKGRLDMVDCPTAQLEAANMKAGATKWIADDWKVKLMIPGVFPNCN